MHLDKVVARIEGGLGNQLFQYAAARSLADRLQCGLLLDLRGIAENGDRPYQLDLYGIRAEVADRQTLTALPAWRSSRAGRIQQSLSFIVPALVRSPVFWPQSFAYDERIEWLRHPVYMVGYWQTERYFAWNRQRLLQDLTLRSAASADSDWAEIIRNCNSVSLHVRRGDYVSNPNAAQNHGTCDLDFYQHSVASLLEQQPDLEVFVFSDEPQWAADHLRLPAPIHIVDANPPDRGHLDLELMSACRHHVLANSSFSWWGAWLCVQPGQTVYAPDRWFANPSVDTRDIIPPHWHRL
ncbi:Fut1_Fut2_like domain containing protein [Comamonadaceae bacterium]